MNILPAIDIRGGKVVRLKQGRLDDQTTYSDDPLATALSWQTQGAHELHVVDLDGAFSGHPRNLALVKKITAKLSIPVQLGGGLRNERAIEEALASGVARVVIGTQAAASMEFLQTIIQRFGADKVVVAIDARDGLVATQGWTVTTSQDALEMAQAVQRIGVRMILYTDISKDGMLAGPNWVALKNLLIGAPQLRIIASGGVSTKDDVAMLRSLSGVYGVVIGKALYDGKLKLSEIL